MKTDTKNTLRFYLKHAANFKGTSAIILICVALNAAIDTAKPYLYKIFFDNIVSGNETSVIYDSLVKIILVILVLNFGYFLFSRAMLLATNYFQPKIMANIYNDCFDYLHRHSYSFFNNKFVGSLVKSINRLVYSFEVLADTMIFNFFPLALRTTMILIVLFFTNKLFSIIFFVWLVIFVILNLLAARYKLKFDLANAAADSKTSGVLADTIANHLNIKLFASLPFELAKFMAATKDWYKKKKKAWDVHVYLESMQIFLMVFLEFFVFFWAIKLWKTGALSVGDFVLLQSYVFSIFEILWNFNRIVKVFYENLADASEMVKILNTPHEIKNLAHAKSLKVKHGEIEFRNVTFAYENKVNVFDNLSFKIKPGEKVGLVGLSGEGKSTAVKLLLRLFEAQKGKIFIDGQEIKKVTLNSLRRQISLVPQEPILFHRTLKENIGYGNTQAKWKEIIAAAKLAYCHDFINKMPQKYGTYVGERGVKLSGGQRQRVAIARAILRNAPILVLDEATSSLDSQSERLIQKALNNLMKKRTALVIAHRLSTIAQMDRILVIQNGQIVEQGSHEELLKIQDGVFKKLWELQRGEEGQKASSL